ITLNVAVLLGRVEVAPADVDRIVLGVVAEADRHDVGSSALTDGGDSRQPSAATGQVIQLGLAENAHLPLLRSVIVATPDAVEDGIDAAAGICLVGGGVIGLAAGRS